MSQNDPATKQDIAGLMVLVEELGESLQRELNNGFDRIDAATKRNTGMIVSGTLAIAGIKKWAASQDAREKRRDTEIRDLRDRVRKLERTRKMR